MKVQIVTFALVPEHIYVAEKNFHTEKLILALSEENKDGSTVEKSSYLNGDNCVEVVHFKVLNGDHTWPLSLIHI